MTGALSYRPSASPLHAARATVGACWALSLTIAVVVIDHPLVLVSIGVACLTASFAVGVGRQVARALRVALAIGVPLVIINVLVSREGLTVFARLGNLGPFGQGDLTVESLVYGLVIALKVSIVILVCALGSLAVDPDELLSACRRISFRSALTTSLTLRMVPLLAVDAQNLAQAQRTRPDAATMGSLRRRALLLAASVGGALDRALDVAATLELRGFATAGRVRRRRRPLSRHDLAFAGSAAGVLVLTLAVRLSRAAAFHAYPLLRVSTSTATLGFCVAIAAVALAPFLSRRGIEPR
ncbi:MAG TPA: energy-coupling factor transporter transmembrane component T [Solirubrobacteraceae bacterium]|jgi:energy-coupling factor transport system permease protein|nr:energy-coupling factor transporter transmembrane component T [Solirubrobacteraceae bacterium]